MALLKRVLQLLLGQGDSLRCLGLGRRKGGDGTLGGVLGILPERGHRLVEGSLRLLQLAVGRLDRRRSLAVDGIDLLLTVIQRCRELALNAIDKIGHISRCLLRGIRGTIDLLPDQSTPL